MIMRLGLGVTALCRNIKQQGTDGIGVVTRNFYQYLKRCSEIDIHPVSFGFAGFENIDPHNSPIILNKFRSLVIASVLSGRPTRGSGMLRERIDIFHAVDHYIPRLSNVPVVATVHDAIPLSNPEWTRNFTRWIVSPMWKKTVSYAEKIITVSNYSKSAISEYFGVASNKITVISNGIDPRWFDVCAPERLVMCRNKYQLPRGYFISVGTFQPRKNIKRIISAYSSLRREIQENFDLVLIGKEGWKSNDVLRAIEEGVSYGRVRWLRYVPDEDLMTLVKGASCLVFPSLSEGFGLPILEAFASRVPVLTSSVTAMPEVAGEAALLVDPYDVEEIAFGMERLVNDLAARENLILKGQHRLEHFTWENNVNKTIEVYKSLI